MDTDHVPMLLTYAGGLLAFTLAFYGLAARERKTPYIIESVYSSCLLVLAGALLALSSKLVPPDLELRTNLEFCALAVLLTSTAFIVWRILRIRNRHLHFRDDRLVANTAPWRAVKGLWRKLQQAPAYEHSPLSMPQKLADALRRTSAFSQNVSASNGDLFKASEPWSAPRSVVVLADRMKQVDVVLSELAEVFAVAECWIQYMSFSRHPIEFTSYLQAKHGATGGTWEALRDRMVVVDGFSPHYGFTDSVCDEKTRAVKQFSIEVLACPPSYAGAHSASAAAFNQIKKKATTKKDADHRKPTLVIYECPRALIDIESAEQYRIFLRHVLPTERLWGAMLTVFVEIEKPSEDDLTVMTAHADAVVDMRAAPRAGT